MPGVPHRDIDTSSWGVKEWRRYRDQGVIALVAWTVIFSWSFGRLLQEESSLVWFVVPVFALGFCLALNTVVRVTIWLRSR